MPDQIFSSATLDFSVYRNMDGSTCWKGAYRGVRVEAALPICQGKRCVVLLDRASFKGGAKHNLLCIGQEGTVTWTAALPDTHDAFVRIDMDGGELHANSLSGYKVSLDKKTGRALHYEFMK